MSIRSMRQERGWSQSQLAQFSGLSLRTIQRLENGRQPTVESLKSLAAVFEVDLKELEPVNTEIDESTLSLDDRKELDHVRKIRRFRLDLLVAVVIVAMMFLADWVMDQRITFAHWAALGCAIWLCYVGFGLFNSGDLFGTDWERRQLEKRTGRKLK